MLPFLKHDKEVGSASSPVETIKRKHDEDSEYNELELAMEELGSHLMSKNWKAAAECFKAAAQLCDEEPHIEGPHV